MRILIPVLSAKGYGGDSYFRSLLPVLSRRSDVECVIIAPDDRYASICSGPVRLEVVPVPALFRGPGRVVWEQTALPRLARKHGAQVVFTANNSGLLASSVPCVIAVRNMEPLVPVLGGTPLRQRARHAVLSRFTRVSAHAATRVVAASEFVRGVLCEMGVPDEKIHTIYHGVDDLPRPDVSAARAGGYLAAAAKFVRYANLETMIRAFARLRAGGYKGELRFAGGSHDAGYEREIIELTRALGVENEVEFLGYRPREEVRAMMRESDAFLFPSTLEACPFTLLEAMSQGAAIVATTAAPMPEFAADGALLVPPQDDEAFAAAAQRAMANPALRVRARARADAFRWKDSVDRLVDVWRRAREEAH